MWMRNSEVSTQGKMIKITVFLKDNLRFIKTPQSYYFRFRKNEKYLYFFNYSWHSILYYFPMYRAVVRPLCNLRSDLPDSSSAHLTPYIVITILLTIFPVLYCKSLWLSCNCQLVPLSPFLFFTYTPNALYCGSHQNVLCIYEFVSVCSFILLFRFHIEVKSYGICLSLSDLFHWA